MKKSEFDILVTNVSAIASQAFSVQCAEFSTVALSNSKVTPDESLDSVGCLDPDMLQSFLENGYRDRIELKDQLNAAWEFIKVNEIDELLNQLPAELANLKRVLDATQFLCWIKYALTQENESALYEIHQAVMASFHEEGGGEVRDLIREAIAFDEVSELENVEIKANSILIEDLDLAITIQSFTVLEWLFPKADISDQKMVSLFENCFDDPVVFNRVLGIINPSKNQQNQILEKAKAGNYEAIAEILDEARIAT